MRRDERLDEEWEYPEPVPPLGTVFDLRGPPRKRKTPLTRQMGFLATRARRKGGSDGTCP